MQLSPLWCGAARCVHVQLVGRTLGRDADGARGSGAQRHGAASRADE